MILILTLPKDRFLVGRNDGSVAIRRFASEKEASAYIEKQPGAVEGEWYLDDMEGENAESAGVPISV